MAREFIPEFTCSLSPRGGLRSPDGRESREVESQEAESARHEARPARGEAGEDDRTRGPRRTRAGVSLGALLARSRHPRSRTTRGSSTAPSAERSTPTSAHPRCMRAPATSASRCFICSRVSTCSPVPSNASGSRPASQRCSTPTARSGRRSCAASSRRCPSSTTSWRRASSFTRWSRGSRARSTGERCSRRGDLSVDGQESLPGDAWAPPGPTADRAGVREPGRERGAGHSADRRLRQQPRAGGGTRAQRRARNWWGSMSAWAVPPRQGALNETRTRPPGSAVTASWAKGGRRR